MGLESPRLLWSMTLAPEAGGIPFGCLVLVINHGKAMTETGTWGRGAGSVMQNGAGRRERYAKPPPVKLLNGNDAYMTSSIA